MLIGYKQILEIGDRKNFAIGAFNCYNMETVMGVLRAAEELHSPVIMQGYTRMFTNDEAYFLAPVILAAAKKASVPVCFNLDHGASLLEVTRAIRYGATGIMIDGSNYEYDENVRITKEVTGVCSYAGIGVEGELGHVGKTSDASMGIYTDPKEAKRFVEETHVDGLAVLVGTAHGRYKIKPNLDIPRIREIRKTTGIPLVLHGGSGVPDDQIQEAIQAGVRKVNFATDICYAFLDSIFQTSRDIVAIDAFMQDPISKVTDYVKDKIELLGGKNKA